MRKKIIICFIFSLLGWGLYNLLDINHITPIISKKLKEEFGIYLKFNKKVEYSLLEPNLIKINNFQIILDKKRLLNIKKLEIDIDLIDLIGNKISINNIILDSLDIAVNKEDISKLKERLKKEDSKTEQASRSDEFRLSVNNLKIDNSNFIYEQYKIENINGYLSFVDNYLNIKKMSFNIYEGEVNFSSILDPNRLNIKVSLLNINLAFLNQILKDKKLRLSSTISGEWDSNIDLKNKIVNKGFLDLESDKTIISGISLDRLIEGFLDSREVGLLDVASYVTMGPFAAILTNTLEATKSVPGIGQGKSVISKIKIKTKIDNNIIIMRDVALKTKENRISFRGKIDIEKRKFNNFNIDILNKKGCSKYTQKVEGTIDSPELGVSKTVLSGVVSPVTDLLIKTKDLVVDCDVVYKGEVTHP